MAQVSYRTAFEPVRAYVTTGRGTTATISGLRLRLPVGATVVVEPGQIVLFDSDGAFKGVEQPAYHGSGY